MNRTSRRKAIALLGLPASLIISRAVWAQTTYEWTGNGLDTLWTDATNWTPISGAGTTYPVSGDSVVFNAVAADGSNIVNLGGGAQGLTNMTFTNGAASYTVGILNSGDALNFDSNATIYASSNLANTQTINANINTAGAVTITTGDVGTLAIGGNLALGGALTVSGASNGAILTISGVISGSGSMTLASTSNFSTNSVGLGTLNLLGHNTYSGGTLLSAPNTVIPITYTPTNNTYGVFGTGVINFNNSANQRLVPTGGSQIIYNSIICSGSGFSMQAPGAGSTFNLTLAGPITFGNAGRYISNGVLASSGTANGGDLILGLATAASTVTLATSANQIVHFVGIAGPTIVNDVVQDATGFPGNVQINDQGQDTNAVILTGASTFSGSCILGNNNASMGVVGVGASTVGSPGSVTSGPFGTGLLIINNTNSVPIDPIGADQTIGNAVRLTSGFMVASASASIDPTGPHNLTLSGPIATGTVSRIITNNLPAGVALTLGLATNPSTITLGGTGATSVSLAFQTQPLAGPGGGVTIVNDVIQDSTGGAKGTMIAQLGGTIYLNAANTFSGGIMFSATSGATVVVSSDANMGSATGGINFAGVAGVLLDTGTFSTARSINLGTNTGAAAGVIDVAAGQTLTLTGGIGNSGDLTKGTNSGTLQLGQTGGGSVSGNVNVNGGTLLVGPTSGETAPFGIGGTLTVNNGAKAAVAQGLSSYSVTNTVSNIVINGSGQVDLANSALITTTPYATVQQYLTNGYNSGAWNGTGGISSANAAADAAMGSNGVGKALGFVSGTSQAGMNLGLSSGQTMVKYTIYGDSNLDGVVNILDFGAFSANFGKSSVGWEEGDYNYDGVVNILDFGKLSANFGHSATATVAMGGASVNTLTGASSAKASASASTVKPAATPAGSGVSVVVNTTTGDVQLSFNNIQSRGYEIDSPSGEMNTFDQFDTPPGPAMLLSDGAIPANDNRGNKYWIVLSSDGDPTRLAEGLNTGYHFSTLPTINQTFDLGDIYVGPSGTNVPDLSVLYVDGSGDGFQQVVQYVGVPEPTTLGLLGLAAAGLLVRRRKKSD